MHASSFCSYGRASLSEYIQLRKCFFKFLKSQIGPGPVICIDFPDSFFATNLLPSGDSFFNGFQLTPLSARLQRGDVFEERPTTANDIHQDFPNQLQPFYIGAENADLEILPSIWAPYYGEAGGVEKVKVRTLDTCYLDLKNVSLLHINEQAAAAGILGAGVKFLQTHMPFVSITRWALGKIEDAISTLRILDDCGYSLLAVNTGTIITETTAEQHLLKENCADFIAVPLDQNRILDFQEKIKLLARKRVVLPIDFMQKHHSLESCFSNNQELRYVAEELVGTPGVIQYEQCMNTWKKVWSVRELSAGNLYEVEGEGEDCWRWTGPRKSTFLRLPLPASGTFFIQVNFFANSDAENETSAYSISVAGKVLKLESEGCMSGTIRSLADHVWITIQTPVLYSEPGERTLGIGIKDIRIETVEERL